MVHVHAHTLVPILDSNTDQKISKSFIKQSAGQMSAAHGQWQASAEQDADPQIAIHYQPNTAPD